MRCYEAREARFSNRTLLTYAATNLPETLAVIKALGNAPAEILLYDEISAWGITAKDFVLALAQCNNAPVTLRINSPGGDVFDGLAIYNALRSYPAPVTCVIDGLAASAASFIALAGQKLVMAENSLMMLHRAWGLVVGNEQDMRDTASILQKIDGQLANIYATKTNKPATDMAALMSAESWFTAAEARDQGLCDVIETSPPVTAKAKPMPRAGVKAMMAKLRNAIQPYDPDGDGDNDAQEALTLMQAAMGILDQACDALTGEDETDTDDAAAMTMPMVPGAELNLTSEVKFSPEEVIKAFEHDRESVQEIEAPETPDSAEMAAKLRFARARQRQAEAEILL